MKVSRLLAAALLVLGMAAPAFAHFGMIIPDAPAVTQAKKTLGLTLSFSHPFEGKGMDMARPQAFSVIRQDGDKAERTELLAALQETKVMGKAAWKTDFKVARPGVYQFVLDPAPYWEPEEDLFIRHLTKVVVPAFGAEDGWDAPAGLKFEIVPLTRPFGNFSGGSFTGQVMLDGKPAPGVIVEAELYNKGKYAAPSEYNVTQAVKTDNAGVFTFSCPQPGWWGFAALTTDRDTLKGPDGGDKSVELGAVLWIYMDAWKQAK